MKSSHRSDKCTPSCRNQEAKQIAQMFLEDFFHSRFMFVDVVCFCFMFDIIFYLFPRQMDQMKFMGPYYEQFVSI